MLVGLKNLFKNSTKKNKKKKKKKKKKKSIRRISSYSADASKSYKFHNQFQVFIIFKSDISFFF